MAHSFVHRGLLVSLLALPLGIAATANSADDVFDKQRLITMVVRGDTGMVVAVFRRFPGRTLPFIDSYLEGGLALIEKGSGKEAEALQSFQTGIKFAKLADEAFGGTAFSEYANAFASWSPTEQQSFREGQRLFREGMKALKSEKGDAGAAVDSLKRSLTLAEALGDTWGQGMAQGGLAEAYMKLGGGDNMARARAAGEAAADLYGRVRLSDDRVQTLLLLSEMRQSDAGPLPFLTTAWEIAAHDPSVDSALRVTVAEKLAALAETAGNPARAKQIREEAARLTPKATPAPEAPKQ